VERANKTMRESLVPVILTDYEQAKREIFKIVEVCNNVRKHSSLKYLTLIQYYRGNTEELIRMRESRIERAGILRKKRNMKEKEVKWQELYHNSFYDLSRTVRNSTMGRVNFTSPKMVNFHMEFTICCNIPSMYGMK
jgi:hypothetical protein